MISISSPNAVVTVDPTAGGRIAQLEVWGIPLLVTRPDDSPDDRSMSWGLFPMAPWVGRLRNGQFSLDGETFQLERDLPPHAIHGTTYTREWTTGSDLGRTSEPEPSEPEPSEPEGVIELRCDLDWPLGGFAQQRFHIDHRSLVCQLTVTADRRMPAEVGWHPWFVKPDGLVFNPDAMYERIDSLPTGNLVPPTAGPWDDCFVNTDPVSLHYPDIVLTVSSDCDHLVVYDEPTHATCVEPQSGPPDAFNLRPRVLEAGERFQRTMTISWQRPSPAGVPSPTVE
jgi:aldose 1-epimerase